MSLARSLVRPSTRPLDLKHKVVFPLLLFAVALVVPAIAHATNIVVNGTFAAGFTGWTTNPAIVSGFGWVFDNGIPAAPSADIGCVGIQCINGTSTQQNFLFQDLVTTPGDSYTLSFEFAAGNSPMELQALFGGAVVDDLLDIGYGPFMSYTVSGLVATSNLTQLEFLGREDPQVAKLTDIDVEDNGPSLAGPVPEPGTLGMVGTGILGIAGAARRKFRT